MDTAEQILREWEKAGCEFALAARLVRMDLEKEKENNGVNTPDFVHKQSKYGKLCRHLAALNRHIAKGAAL